MTITLNALLSKQRVFGMTWAGAIVPGPPGCECGFVTRVTALWRKEKTLFTLFLQSQFSYLFFGFGLGLVFTVQRNFPLCYIFVSGIFVVYEFSSFFFFIVL